MQGKVWVQILKLIKKHIPGWMGGWVGEKAVLRIVYSNQKTLLEKCVLFEWFWPRKQGQELLSILNQLLEFDRLKNKYKIYKLSEAASTLAFFSFEKVKNYFRF